jgi:hypothetical protein
MADVFSVSASWSQASYNAGQTMTGTISGTNTHTTSDTTTHQTAGPVTIPVSASPSGAQSTVTLAGVDVATTAPGSTTTEQVTIDTTRPIVDSGATPRNWVVSADRKSISAVA